MQNKNMMWLWVLIVVLVIAGAVYLTNNKKINNMETNSGAAKAGDLVSMNYTGKLSDGTVFDSNVDPKFNHVEPFEFTLGAGQVISGWDKGVLGMKVGETKTLVIPPAEAYGEAGYGTVIPPNSTLIFDVEVVNITSGGGNQ
ncbi:MAG: FKBP-type peptidyl-prolyl cis-trans isomerase [bacterium]|nr:FKBP-type peptidyl-prolyl cis-trans isomerase [bacterium]